ncbi:hypothetical protein [Spirosoma spitsbergense]|uniref:hypothetical protein n=1 Tax=Spirosoma spitsbergense TaxID=431554 RepID=UPI00035C62A1|nr:hypothetical protein [Spirosoma spitsbergense]
MTINSFTTARAGPFISESTWDAFDVMGSGAQNTHRSLSELPGEQGLMLAKTLLNKLHKSAGIWQSNLASTTINGLASLGFDEGPLFLSAVYHYGFQDILKEPVEGIVNSQRRILSVNVGLKF